MKTGTNIAAIIEEKAFINRLALADMVRRNPRVIHKQQYLNRIAGELNDETGAQQYEMEF